MSARIGVITFPGTLDDVDASRAVKLAGGEAVSLWHGDADLKGVDAVIVPGGFSYGDYLRCGAIARFAPVMGKVVELRVSEGERLIRSGKWQGWGPMSMLGHRIYGKRLGIIGMGRIGQAVARRAKGFGLSVHYHNRRRVAPAVEQALEATYWESLDQMLSRMDIISINCPHTPGTYHLLSARRLKLLKPDAIVVNTARGEIIDETALARLIEAGDVAGAGLDVFEHEPAVNPRLVKLARQGKVVLLPHMGSATFEGRVDMGEKVIVNIKTFMDGHRPPYQVLEGWA